MLIWMILGPIAAGLLSAILCAGVVRFRVLDMPDEVRKADIQDRPVPTSGGVGFIAATGLVLLSATISTAITRDLWIVGACVVVALGLGLLDDLRPLNSRIKLFGQLAIAVALVLIGPHVEAIAPGFGRLRDFGLYGGVFFSVLWLLTTTNAVNFMDGANGLSMGIGLFACIGFSAVAGWIGLFDLMLLMALLAGALAGFLVWNLPGKLFAGDAGALALGMALGGASLMIVQARPELVFIPPIILSPYLVDVVLTLIWRTKRKQPLFKAHTDHVYQVVLKSVPLHHWQLSIGHWMVAANCVALAVAATMIGFEMPLAVFTGVYLLGAFMHIRIRRAAAAIQAEKEAAEAAENQTTAEA